VSSVLAAEVWPNVCWTIFTSAPLAIAMLDPRRLAVADATEDEVIGLLVPDEHGQLRTEVRGRDLTADAHGWSHRDPVR